MGTKAVRFSDKDEKLINEFLKKNPMFDFSLLARTAILNFIENPEIKLKPIGKVALKNKQRARSVVQ
jgi:hypothetical protein